LIPRTLTSVAAIAVPFPDLIRPRLTISMACPSSQIGQYLIERVAVD